VRSGGRRGRGSGKLVISAGRRAARGPESARRSGAGSSQERALARAGRPDMLRETRRSSPPVHPPENLHMTACGGNVWWMFSGRRAVGPSMRNAQCGSSVRIAVCIHAVQGWPAASGGPASQRPATERLAAIFLAASVRPGAALRASQRSASRTYSTTASAPGPGESGGAHAGSMLNTRRDATAPTLTITLCCVTLVWIP